MFDTAATTNVNASFVSGMKILLPADTVRENNKVLERVTVPPPTHTPRMTREAPVPITAFSRVGQMAFKGYAHACMILALSA